MPVAAITVNPSNILKNIFKPSNGGPNGAAHSTKQVIEDESKYVLHTYARAPVVISHGKGAKMWDVDGNEYIDMAAGIAVNALGHSDSQWFAALADQAAKLSHTSNLYHTTPQVDLAKRLVENSFADKVFFCNTGTEANEGAIKFARKWARVRAGVDPYDANAVAPYELVSFTSCFHGRTMGALALTYKEQYKTPFYPMMPGHRLAEYNDLNSAAAVIEKGKTAAVFVEPVQGEGGVTPSKLAFLKGLRDLCDEAGALLVFDEVQCGLGRTGASPGGGIHGTAVVLKGGRDRVQVRYHAHLRSQGAAGRCGSEGKVGRLCADGHHSTSKRRCSALRHTRKQCTAPSQLYGAGTGGRPAERRRRFQESGNRPPSGPDAAFLC